MYETKIEVHKYGNTLTNRDNVDIYKLMELVNDLKNQNFYGELLIKYEAGKVVICKKTETIKI
jgi:hypothetical protein